MDLYRYFHPHHNPRLRNIPLRMQELGELEQAAVELKKAVNRARIRVTSATITEVKEERFGDMLQALDFIIDSLSGLTNAHPGDDKTTMIRLLEERRNAPGWENWTRLLEQRLELPDA